MGVMRADLSVLGFDERQQAPSTRARMLPEVARYVWTPATRNVCSDIGGQVVSDGDAVRARAASAKLVDEFGRGRELAGRVEPKGEAQRSMEFDLLDECADGRSSNEWPIAERDEFVDERGWMRGLRDD